MLQASQLYELSACVVPSGALLPSPAGLEARPLKGNSFRGPEEEHSRTHGFIKETKVIGHQKGRFLKASKRRLGRNQILNFSASRAMRNKRDCDTPTHRVSVLPCSSPAGGLAHWMQKGPGAQAVAWSVNQSGTAHSSIPNPHHHFPLLAETLSTPMERPVTHKSIFTHTQDTALLRT